MLANIPPKHFIMTYSDEVNKIYGAQFYLKITFRISGPPKTVILDFCSQLHASFSHVSETDIFCANHFVFAFI